MVALSYLEINKGFFEISNKILEINENYNVSERLERVPGEEISWILVGAIMDISQVILWRKFWRSPP